MRALILLCLCLLCQDAIGQNAFWNAIYLYNAKEKSTQIIDDSLRQQILTDSFLMAPFEHQPDMNFVARVESAVEDSDLFLQSDAAPVDPAALSTLSTPTLLIDGTARFLAERFREEATVLYISKFKEKLGDLGVLDTLLPKTSTYLESANYFDVQALGNNFKDAFEDDLQHLLVNLRDYLEYSSNIGGASFEEGRLALAFSLDIANELIENTHPVELLEYLDNTYKDRPEYKKYYEVIHLANILQLNLREREPEYDPTNPSSEKQRIWISMSDLRLLNTQQEVEYFLAGIYHQDTAFFNQILDDFPIFSGAKEIDGISLETYWKQEVAPILLVLQQLENILDSEQVNADDYIQLIDSFVDLLLEVDKKLGSLAEQDLEILDRIIDVYQSIHKRNYAFLVSNGTWLIHELLQAEGRLEDKEIATIISAMQKYGTFMVDIVNADDSGDVKEAIQRNVTSFSYLDKRNSQLSLTFMGLPSFAGGMETLGTDENDNWQGTTGISCPLGLDFSFQRRKKVTDPNQYNPNYVLRADENDPDVYLNRNSVFGLFLGIADIGAPFMYRLDGTDSALPDNISFKQVFSPSASFYYSFAKSPVTLAVGWQYAPELREVTVDGLTLDDNAQRIIARVSWDIPLIKLAARN